MKVEEILNNKKLANKFVYEYWYSIPSDSDKAPDKIEITNIDKHKINYMLYEKGICYSGGTCPIWELQKYLDKIGELWKHKQEVDNVFNNEEVKNG